MVRLLERYRKEVVPHLQEKLGRQNVLSLPRLEKIVVSMGLGKSRDEAKRVEAAVEDLSLITGQKPIVTKAKKSVSAFRLREGMPIGCKATLRGARMYEFLDRLINLAIPRFRDFRGLDPNAFDGRGNYNMGVNEQLVFPEVRVDKVQFQQGMNITIVIKNSRSDEESRWLLEAFGFPFRRD
ncbi:MAG: 50S ribosomal protein L5 [Planctomycetota bacterium]|jgi:large subunit ribosomal protein L5|nr:50S ribosomal protein L5 [Planctomycetota bacterium]